MNEVYTYNQTLALIEEAMISSGIRDFCTNICKGKCCGSCRDTNPNACIKVEGRRLACSIYLCSEFRGGYAYSKLRHHIIDKMHKMNGSNIYFEITPEIFSKLKELEFDKDIVDAGCEDIKIINLPKLINR